MSFPGLTTNYCKKISANIIFRGLRVASDFEYEFQLAGMNNKLNKNEVLIVTVHKPQSK